MSFCSSFDDELGGFGGAPKFPRPVVFNFLLREAVRDAEGERTCAGLCVCVCTVLCLAL